MTDPQNLLNKLDWEGWPEGITWFQPDDFEDKALSKLVERALDLYQDLETVHKELKDRCEELGAELP